nr:nucleolar and coiled-body phosphoprotein 1-like [Aegilops tauschii subsp. strangulata]
MAKTLLGESSESCSKTGLNPFCALNPAPDADSSFWSKKLQDKPAKKVRAKTKPSKKNKKKSDTSELFALENESEGTSHPSSSDSTGTQMPPFKIAPGGIAKPSKKLMVGKPVEDPKVHEPEKQTPSSEASNQNPEDTADDPPPETHDTPVDPMSVDPSSAKPPSPIKPAEEDTEDVLITGTGYVESGNPTVLAKHSAKEELLEKSKTKFDIASYSNLDVNELWLSEPSAYW